MNKKTLFICALLSSFVLVQGVFAQAMKYEDYVSDAVSYCDKKDRPWNKWLKDTDPLKRLVPKLTFPALESDSVNGWMDDQIKEEKSTLWKRYLEEALDPTYIGSFDGLKTLEAAQSVYHARMNGLFDCAVISSRIGLIMWLQKSKALKWSSEIIKKLDWEIGALNILSEQCLPAETENATTNPTVYTREISLRLAHTAGLQYCHYRKYLSYLDSNLNADITKTLETEKRIGQDGTGPLPDTTDRWASELIKRQLQLEQEIYRADRSLPRSIMAFNEMQRTYAAHLLLVIVYDDYVRLRDNLARYMSPTSQLFEKAFNAMAPK
jgi:hypothetical protein